ncbi:MAG: hypothetical protein V9F00_17570 [Nocardioides sp.]
MNNNEFYERRDDRAMPEPPTPQPQSDEAVSALALHRDPSVPDAATPAEAKAQRGIAWVRPSELPTLVGSKWVGRGIDLQSELVRRSRRAPGTAARAGRRISRTAIARPEQATPTATTEELGL